MVTRALSPAPNVTVLVRVLKLNAESANDAMLIEPEMGTAVAPPVVTSEARRIRIPGLVFMAFVFVEFTKSCGGG